MAVHARRFPGESAGWSEARNALLEEERALRRAVERVAEMRRALPPGPLVEKAYLFEEWTEAGVRRVAFADLFEDGRDTLLVYSFMYPAGGAPCPMCTAFLDSLDGNARHLRRRVALAVVAQAPAAELERFARSRGWRWLRLLSGRDTDYSRDWYGENEAGAQLPMLNVFRRDADGIRHFWGSELMFADAEPGQDPRHLDLHWPLWTLLDLTPGGRGDWYPDPASDAPSLRGLP